MKGKIFSKFLAVGAAGVMLSSGSAYGLSIALDDGNNGSLEVVVGDDLAAFADTGDGTLSNVNDANVTPGAVVYNGAAGPSWLVSVTTGLGDPLLGGPGFPVLNLSSVDVSNGEGDLLIYLADSDKGYSGAYTFEIGGQTDGTVTFGYTNSSMQFDPVASFTPLGPTGPGVFSLSGIIPASGASGYNVLTALIHHDTAFQTTGFDYEIVPVPEPGTYALLGAGLLVAASVRRRKKVSV